MGSPVYRPYPTRKSNHLQMLLQRQHFLLSYFKTLSVGPGGIRTHDLSLSGPALSQLSWTNRAALQQSELLYLKGTSFAWEKRNWKKGFPYLTEIVKQLIAGHMMFQPFEWTSLEIIQENEI